MEILGNQLDRTAVTEIWEAGLTSVWSEEPVWVHGDLAPSNLLVDDGRLCAVIDFGQLGVGDPACDYAICWTFLSSEARTVFRDHLDIDEATWSRARAWALWKALIILADPESDTARMTAERRTLRELLTSLPEGWRERG